MNIKVERRLGNGGMMKAAMVTDGLGHAVLAGLSINRAHQLMMDALTRMEQEATEINRLNGHIIE